MQSNVMCQWCGVWVNVVHKWPLVAIGRKFMARIRDSLHYMLKRNEFVHFNVFEAQKTSKDTQ